MSSTTKAIQVDARPEPLTLDPRSAAVIVVDMQNDFAAAGGMFDRAGIPVNAIQAIVDPTREVLRASRAAGIQVVYLKMQFAADLSNAGPPDAPKRRKHAPLGLGEETATPDGPDGADPGRGPVEHRDRRGTDTGIARPSRG